MRRRIVLLGILVLAAGPLLVVKRARADESNGLGDVRSFQHMSQEDIVAGRLPLDRIIAHGKLLFDTPLNRLDGQGRPATTGGGAKRVADQPPFIRTSAPDSSACAGCHSQPRSGGGGDFVANVFVLAQTLDPVTTSVDAEFSNERNTLGMMGAGPVEALGREMTRDLLGIRDEARRRAAATGQPATLPLRTKGVDFGSVTAFPDGRLDTSRVVGVDVDLVIKPFHQKGVVRSIREFTVNAFNHHHGLQAVERFGLERTGTRDFDEDGVEDEMSVGDITAATLYQATLNTPGRVRREDPVRGAAVRAGEAKFGMIGCTSCHVPKMTLDSPIFCEPYGLNPAGTFSDTSASYCFDMTRDGPKPRLERSGQTAIVRAFTDLKRHVICDAEVSHYCNEKKIQSGVPTNQFITRKLWDAGNSAPYGHRGDLTTLTEAIEAHGGEGRAARDAFLALPRADRDAIIEFLKSLQILPDGSPIETPESALKASSLNDR
ncbi:MAG TPA: di-heme oxidoredictase family protein [Candidatus Polarisedimenticolia bacterium]|nr:di-heme oxidoredictase family protein [Candidatus Polarisedimenticolia bacterium]